MQGISAKCKFFGLPYSKFLLPVYRDWMLSFFPDGRVIFVPQRLTLHGLEELDLETGVGLFHLMQTIEQKAKAVIAAMQRSASIPPPPRVYSGAVLW